MSQTNQPDPEIRRKVVEKLRPLFFKYKHRRK
jgi:hypothetical protein